MKPKHIIVLFSVCWVSNFALCFAQGLGNGQDGSPNISGTINSYTYLVQNANRCDGVLMVANAQEFNAEDIILIMQMQGVTIDGSNTSSYGTISDYNNAGNYEFAEALSVDGNEITLKYALTRDYTATGKVQIIKVPQYKNPAITGTLTCPAWDGTTGGVLVLDAQDTITMKANINVMGKGFRGGEHHKGIHIDIIRYDYAAESPDPDFYALKGEGIAFYGIDPFASARGAPANGGGGGNVHTTGGGGGSDFGCGGDGGWGYPVDGSGGEKLVYGLGGYPLSYSNADNKVFLGGGGGAGHEHFGNGTSGANGGGIVIIMCKAIEGNGYSIFARGNNSAGSGAYGDGAGGAGAGGSVLLSVENFSRKLFVDVSGGAGGSTIAIGFGYGGGGGGGGCWFSNAAVPDSVTVILSGGLRGTAGGVFYGGSDGCDGGILYNLQVPFNTAFPSVIADFSTSPANLTVNDTTIAFNNLSAGGTFSYWDFGDSKTNTAPNPTHTYSSFGTYTIRLIESNAMCSDTMSKIISTEFDIPDVFTPNGDNINDIFPGTYFNDISTITIFNRWGQIVFERDVNNTNWDGTYNGKEMTAGTYFYIIEFINSEGGDSTKKGTVTLLQ